ncbi:hypothetical protein GOP47_0011143 [Adiantum capillus-veneris]|uniref:Inward rectifier potassium channel C-terminal domain-containing protein n=1 Tax=Adiantum capillus-veneris TaxID=13818 RepID=A0A9D4USL7_ADICA|nr:hypothetical protein GOP47_0011143 [Adiantum capillus-veneris]
MLGNKWTRSIPLLALLTPFHGWWPSPLLRQPQHSHQCHPVPQHSRHLHFDGIQEGMKASVGRLSGAVHGGNSRKGRIHKRCDTQKQQNSRELENLHEKEMVDEPISEYADHHQDTDFHVCSDTALGTDENFSSKCTASLLANTSVYDSIHGDFWMNDPYYQAFEAVGFQDGRPNPEDKRLRTNEFASQYGNILDSRTVPQTTVAEADSLMCRKAHNSFQEPVGVPERNQHLNVDHQRTFYDQINTGENGFRKVESAERPLAKFGSLDEIEVHVLENRFSSGNAVEQVGQVVEQVADSIIEQVASAVDQVEKLPQVAEEVVLKVVDQVTEVLPDPVVEQVGQVAEQVTQTAEQVVEHLTSQVVEPISTTASQIANFLSSDEEDEESDDEFEAYTSLDIPEFKGRQGLNNFTILQDEHGFLAFIYDFYIFMLKRSVFEFCLGMFAAPVLLSMVFTLLYLPQFNGLALDETVLEFFKNSNQNSLEGLQMSWQTVFQVFMFSVSLSTGLQPELAPLSPYTLVVANLNALIAQLIFVFLSGAVFARLSQPSQPVKCSTVALICPAPSNRRLRREACYKALLTRYVLAGPQPCELVDVKVDLTYLYNTVTRSGTYFRTSQSLKLVRPEIAFLDHGMVVRHVIDETSPLYQRTRGMLEKEDAVFSLSVVGLERSSMQSVFHVQHYCVYDKDVVWDAEWLFHRQKRRRERRLLNFGTRCSGRS